MSGFDVLLVAASGYPTPPGPLPARENADAFAALVTGERGGATIEPVVVASTEADLIDAIRRWAEAPERQRGAIVYLVGHGRSDGLDHEFLVPDGGRVVPVRTVRLAELFQRDWLRRQHDQDSWTLFVLDCCASDDGVANLVSALAGRLPKRPKNLALWPVAPGGAAWSGAFVAAFARALDTYTENDVEIPLHDVFRRMRRELGDLQPEGFLPDGAALVNPLRTERPVVITLDAHAELRDAIARRPPEFRSHFLSKAQGAEAGELVWHFHGRDAEIADLCAWTDHGPPLRVVTGEPGSGKSALLGHVAVLADDELVDLYRATGLAPSLATGPRPPHGSVAAAVHLTGKTLLETVAEVADELGVGAQVALDDADAAVETFADALRETHREGAVVVLDALDEAQEPDAIAEFVRDTTRSGRLRVLVGTRRSLTEGPDQPADTGRELLDSLAVEDADLLVVGNDPEAVERYVRERLAEPHSPYQRRPDDAAAIASRIRKLDQPFLFARLATAELLARPALDPRGSLLADLLDCRHRGLFAAATTRLGAHDPRLPAMLRALSHARGRGLPRTGGIWAHVAAAIVQRTEGLSREVAHRRFDDEAVASCVAAAAAYITLDAEAGQSTYRLAHQTFVEHFRVEPDWAAQHRMIGRSLWAVAEAEPGGWATANHYVVRFVPEHLLHVAHRPNDPDFAGLAELVTDGGWLPRALDQLGIDLLVDVVAAARRVGDAFSWYDPALDVIEPVERALRRSRVALGRDPAQLAGQLHARLSNEPAPRLAALGEAVALHAGNPWLRMVEGSLGWRSDLEATYGKPGTVRAVAIGEIGFEPTVAIAIDNHVELWDPRASTTGGGVTTIDLGNLRATALALATIGGRDVVVAACGYDGIIAFLDAATGQPARRHVDVDTVIDSVAVDTTGNAPIVAAAGAGELRRWRLDDGAPMIDVHGDVTRGHVHAVATRRGKALAIVSERGDDGGLRRFAAVNPADGSGSWSAEVPPGLLGVASDLDAVGAGELGDRFLVAVAAGSCTLWLTEDEQHIEGHSQPDVPVRSLAVGEIDGLPVVVSAPRFHGTGFVEVIQVAHQPTAAGVTLFRPRDAGGVWSPPDGVDTTPADHELGPVDVGPGSLSLDAPEHWPRACVSRGELAGRPVVVVGSIAGSAWVWDVAGPPVVVAGPFHTPSPAELELGHRRVKAARARGWSSSAAIGTHPVHGPIVAVASDGDVELWSVDGRAFESPVTSGLVIDAVALGQLLGRDVLVTGSTGGAIAVWELDPARHVASLTIDQPIEDVWIVPGADRTVASDGTGRYYALDLVDPTA